MTDLRERVAREIEWVASTAANAAYIGNGEVSEDALHAADRVLAMVRGELRAWYAPSLDGIANCVFADKPPFPDAVPLYELPEESK